MGLNKKKRYILILILTIITIFSIGTYAWLSYRSNDTAMVLTVGDINNVRITMSPYQINTKIAPNVDYTEEKYTTIEVINNSSSPRNIKLFYTINAIDSELATSSMKYTIEKKDVSSSSYVELTPYGNFNGATKGDEITILEESVPVGTTLYKVYVWLQGASSAQNNVPGKQFNVELNAIIAENQYQVTFDANGGTVSPETMVVEYGGTYQNLPEPSRTGYTFLGWNGKNMLYTPDTNSTTKNEVTVSASSGVITLSGENTSSSAYGIIQYRIALPELVIGKQYTFSTTNISNNSYNQINYHRLNLSDDGFNLPSGRKSITFTVPDNYTETAYWFVGIYGTTTTINHQYSVQLEEGTEATPYEPYFIESNTTVVQEKNHTLTAIWQKNS